MWVVALGAVLVGLEGVLYAGVVVIAACGEQRAQDGIFGGGSVVVSTLPFTGGDIGGSGVCGCPCADLFYIDVLEILGALFLGTRGGIHLETGASALRIWESLSVIATGGAEFSTMTTRLGSDST